MTEQTTLLFAWMQENEILLWWLGAASILMFIGSLILIPYLVVRIPHDYFTRTHSLSDQLHQSHPLLRISGMLAKNLLGIIFIIAGIAMLVLPGQGILTILIGLMLMNFPGKYDLERRIIQKRPVLKAINWMRRKAHHRPLEMAQPGSSTRPSE